MQQQLQQWQQALKRWQKAAWTPVVEPVQREQRRLMTPVKVSIRSVDHRQDRQSSCRAASHEQCHPDQAVLPAAYRQTSAQLVTCLLDMPASGRLPLLAALLSEP